MNKAHLKLGYCETEKWYDPRTDSMQGGTKYWGIKISPGGSRFNPSNQKRTTPFEDIILPKEKIN